MKKIGVLVIVGCLFLAGCGTNVVDQTAPKITTTNTQTTSQVQNTKITTTTSALETTTEMETTKVTTTSKVTTTTKAVSFEEVGSEYFVTSEGKLRTKPYDDAPIDRLLKIGEKFYVIGAGSNGWNKVKTSKGDRYIWHEYLSKNKPTTAKKTEAKADSSTVSSKGYSIVTKNGITYVDGILVANKTYSLPSSYCPGGLLSECDKAYDRLDAAAASAGYELYISSGFRSYETQESIYNRYVANDGKANADRYSARPGYSEHQTGLAIDLNGVSDNFGNTSTGKWVAAHAHEYGFIIRYPKGKEAQTGYMYEPWHIRYVGVDAATKIYTSGLCLEEYYGITSSY